MSNLIKFGRKVALPSTILLKHELSLMAAVDDLSKAGLWDAAAGPTDDALRDVAGELARTHGLSIDRATMLVDRFGDNHHTLETIAAVAIPGAA